MPNNADWVKLIFHPISSHHTPKKQRDRGRLTQKVRQRKKRRRGGDNKKAGLCSLLKSDPSRVDYTVLTPSVAGLVDDMIGDSDQGTEHT